MPLRMCKKLYRAPNMGAGGLPGKFIGGRKTAS